MQIIQSIREKGAVIVIVVIALSLIGFILMDARSGNKGVADQKIIGKVNNLNITAEEFIKRKNQLEQTQQNQNRTGIESYIIEEQAWNQLVEEKLIRNEAEKLGIIVTDKELSELLNSNDPNNPLSREQSLLDSLTRKLDKNKVQTMMNQIKTSKGPERERANLWLESVKESMYRYKYSVLLSGSAYYPDWMQKRDVAAKTNTATLSYVNIPYSSISDSLIKVTDADINDYIKKHPAQFKANENLRKISYLSFKIKPSKNDSLSVYNDVLKTIEPFREDSSKKINIKAPYIGICKAYDSVVQKKDLEYAIAANIATATPNTVYGPYIKNGNYVVAKVQGMDIIPDSARARHILFQTYDPNNPQNPALMKEADAKKLADSVLGLIKSGSKFDSLCTMYSADGSKEKGGDLGYFAPGRMVKAFNDFCFYNAVGKIEVVKTEFGYHIIEITDQKTPNPAYNISYISKEIFTSDETSNNISDLANRASECKDKNSLIAFGNKNGANLISEPMPLTESAYMLNTIPNIGAKDLIKWAFSATPGAVSASQSIGDQYVVAVLENVINKGSLVDVATAKNPIWQQKNQIQNIETKIANNKKAALIKTKAGSGPTLQALETTFSIKTDTATITFEPDATNKINESKVLGAAFNKSNTNMVSPAIEGEAGVYYITVTQTGTKEAPSNFEIQLMSRNKAEEMKNTISKWIEGLKKKADIVDDRAKNNL